MTGATRCTARASYERWGGGGEGVSDPKGCVPKMARPDFFPIVNFAFFPRWSLWSGGGEGFWGKPPPPSGF